MIESSAQVVASAEELVNLLTEVEASWSIGMINAYRSLIGNPGDPILCATA